MWVFDTSDRICFSRYVTVWWQDFTFLESVCLDGAVFNIIAVSQCQNVMYLLQITCPTTLCQFDMWKDADVPRSDVHPQLIEPSTTELYYTMSVSHVEECRCTQVRCTLPLPQLNLVVQSPTTPCQFDMWKNAGIPRSDVHPQLIEPSATELYYTMSVWYVEEYRCTQVRSSPQSNLVVQSPTTPCQFDMLKNAGVPRSDVPPNQT